MPATVTNAQKVLVTLHPVTDNSLPGSVEMPGPVDAPPVWAKVSGADTTIEVNADGLSAWIISGTQAGASMYSVDATSQGNPLPTVFVEVDVTIIPAALIRVSYDAPVSK